MGAELREDVGHLQRAAHGVGCTVDPLLGLLAVLDGQHAEGDRHPGLDRRQLEAARRLARDVVEMRRLTADHASECDDRRVAARLRQRHRGTGSSNAPGTGMIITASRDSDLVELGERPLQQRVGDLRVELADDDADRAPAVDRPLSTV